MSIDLTLASETFAAVAETALDQNDWVVDAILRTDDDHGIVLIYRPEHPIERAYGTAAFKIQDDEEVLFHWGHYDLNKDDAKADFGLRCQRGY